mgnify:FL=1
MNTLTMALTPCTVAMVTASHWAFWTLAPIMVLAALGMVVARKPVHSALFLAVIMISLAVQYASMQAPFLFVVQIIVYTGAILMLFLFVVMLVGVDTSESLADTLRSHRVASTIAAIGIGVMLVVAVGHAVTVGNIGTDAAVGLERANAAHGDNVHSLAVLIFTQYVIPFEATSALLITAALGTMVLAHGERLHRKKGQPERMSDRMDAYLNDGAQLASHPAPGVYARSNEIGAPALLPDGTVAQASVSKALASRGGIIDAGELKAPTASAFATISASRREVEGELE